MLQRRDSVNSTFRLVTRFNVMTWRKWYALVFGLMLVLSVSGFSQASREEALAKVYPGAAIRPERLFLTNEQIAAARALAGTDVETALVARYLAVADGKAVGRAYIDTHVVRTKRESLLICLDEKGAVKRIEVTAFLEPPEYEPPPAWYAQFAGKPLNDALNIDRAIRPIAGATLTGAATTRAVRRILAIDRVVTGVTTGERRP